MSISVINKKIILENKIPFEQIYPLGEDSLFMSRLIYSLSKRDICYINSNKYFYRKREEKNSTIDKANKKKDFFIEYLKNFYLLILEEVYNVPNWLANQIIYDLQKKHAVDSIKELLQIKTELQSKTTIFFS